MILLIILKGLPQPGKICGNMGSIWQAQAWLC